ncbi:MAG: undecaprenyl-diphosphate phosphatase [Planctomycetales bacterium]|nr:undecaprenyl-diphosphate phosphatase [Planctomycetales bacterium]
MNDYWSSAIQGIVEGLTEFLPVSSTAHIRFTQLALGISPADSYWKMFSIVIQLGAILAVLVYFRSRLVGFVRSFPQCPAGRSLWWQHPLSLVVISFVVTALPCFLMDKLIGENMENMQLMAAALVIGGIIMWGIDKIYSPRAQTYSMEGMSLKQAIAIGLFQILAATFPGVSRSMSTIAGGQVMGLSRSAALEFSFFLSIPVMMAATSYKLLQYVLERSEAPTFHQWTVLAVGFLTSFGVAWVVIAWFMLWVKKRGFGPFAIYRIVAGGVALAWLSTLSG